MGKKKKLIICFVSSQRSDHKIPLATKTFFPPPPPLARACIMQQPCSIQYTHAPPLLPAVLLNIYRIRVMPRPSPSRVLFDNSNKVDSPVVDILFLVFLFASLSIRFTQSAHCCCSNHQWTFIIITPPSVRFQSSSRIFIHCKFLFSIIILSSSKR